MTAPDTEEMQVRADMTDREQQKSEAYALYECAEKEYYDSKLREANAHLEQVLSMFKELEDYEMQAKTYNLMGVVHAAIGNVVQEIDSYIMGLKCAREHDVPYTELVSLNNLGSHYLEIEENEQALQFFEECREKAQYLNADVFPRIAVLRRILSENLALAHLKLGHLEQAEHYLAQAEKNLAQKDVQVYDVRLLRNMILCRKGMEEEVRKNLPELEKCLLDVSEPADFLTRVQEYVTLLKDIKAYDYWERIVSIYYRKMGQYHNTEIRICVLEMCMDYARTLHREEDYKNLCVQYVDAVMDRKEEDRQERKEIADIKVELFYKEKERATEAREKLAMQELAETDALTGLGSRYSLHRYGTDLLEKAKEEHTYLVVGLIDVDCFKQYNDTYGHVAGDRCLERLSEVLRQCLRRAVHEGACGRTFRYGGDELMVVLTDIDMDGLKRFAEQLQNEVRALRIDNPNAPNRGIVTVSQGYFCQIPGDTESLEDILKKADVQLYKVKDADKDDYLITVGV